MRDVADTTSRSNSVKTDVNSRSMAVTLMVYMAVLRAQPVVGLDIFLGMHM